MEEWIVTYRAKEPRRPFNTALFEPVPHSTIVFIRPSVENGGVDLILCRVLCRKYLNCRPPSQTRESLRFAGLIGRESRVLPQALYGIFRIGKPGRSKYHFKDKFLAHLW